MTTPTNIWVERDRYHTAIVFPTQLVQEIAAPLLPVLDHQPLVRFGWGDRRYYGANHKNVVMALAALFLPTRSVMEVSSFNRLEDVGDSIVPLNSQQIDIQKLLAHIADTFTWDGSGQPILERIGVNGHRYYSARGVYSFFKNCNNWTAKALKKSGLKIHYLWAFFANSVMKQL